MVVLTWVLAAVSALGVAGAAAAFIFVPTIAMPIAEKVVKVLLGCAVCLWVSLVIFTALGSYWYGRHGEYDKGHTAAIAEIAAEDEAAVTHALEKRNVWKDCKARSGTWDQSTGDCK
jgi:hypothetical protein